MTHLVAHYVPDHNINWFADKFSFVVRLIYQLPDKAVMLYLMR